MENYQEKWEQCQRLIQQQLQDPWIWSTWFQSMTFESYDPKQNRLLLQVPSTYVYQFVEHYYVRLMKKVITETFGSGVSLSYRILQNAAGRTVDFTLDATACRTFIKVPDAAARLREEMSRHVRGELRWLPAYDRVARWLSDNKGRGLLCCGTNGLGKSIICQRVLPAILQQDGIVQCQATDMASRIDELTKAGCVIIDDLGKESVEYKNYGNVRKPFFELCSAVEQRGSLLIITTNLSTTPVSDPRYPDSIEHRYGSEVTSRLRALVLAVEFTGPDLRP